MSLGPPVNPFRRQAGFAVPNRQSFSIIVDPVFNPSRRPAEEGRLLAQPLHGHTKNVMSLALSGDGTLLATASLDRTVRLWELESRTCVGVLHGHRSHVFHCAFSPDGQHIATAADTTVRVWNLRERCVSAILPDEAKGSVVYCSWSPDSTLLAAEGGWTNSSTYLWDTTVWKRLCVIDTLAFCGFSPCGRYLPTMPRMGVLRLWDVQSAGYCAELTGHTDRIYDTSFCVLGGALLLASASGDRSVRVWDTRSSKPVAVLHGHSYAVSRAMFSASGTHLVSVAFDGSIRLWDTRDWNRPVSLLHDATLPTGCAHKASFSPDGALLACAMSKGSMALWDVAAVHRAALLHGPPCEMADFAFAPDGRSLATAYEEVAYVWPVPPSLHPRGSTEALSLDEEYALGDRLPWREAYRQTHAQVRPVRYNVSGANWGEAGHPTLWGG